jgi:hypothetical protein
MIGQRAGLRVSVSRSFRFNSSILRDLHGFTYREGRFWAAFLTEIYPSTGFLGRAWLQKHVAPVVRNPPVGMDVTEYINYSTPRSPLFSILRDA